MQPNLAAEKEEEEEVGLLPEQVEAMRQMHGFNEVPAPKASPLWGFLGHFVGIAPLIMEATIVACLALEDWLEAGVVFALLIFNLAVAMLENHRAAVALMKLQQALVINARVLRSGAWAEVPSKELVPGDVLRLRQGDICPADVEVTQGEVSADQSALTGESAAVTKPVGAVVFAGSVIQRGEARAKVTLTGMKTKFNKTVELVKFSAPKLHVTDVVNKIVAIEMGIAIVLVVVSIIILVAQPSTRATFVSNIPTLLLLIVLAAPITLPPMLNLTMALGSLSLSEHGLLVTRLNALEDASAMTVLCTDKTGTLTTNRLSVVGTFVLPSMTMKAEELLSLAATACKRENAGPIDFAILDAVPPPSKESPLRVVGFEPFTPATRRTVATVVHEPSGRTERVSLGAVKSLLADLKATPENDAIRQAISDEMNAASEKGFRSIGLTLQDVAAPTLNSEQRSSDSQKDIVFAGLIFLADPPRHDSKATVDRLHEMGIRVIMLTGDSLTIGKYVAVQVGIGGDVRSMAEWHIHDGAIDDLDKINGLAEVFPEDKHQVVKQLQAKSCVVGMTGDGVNDAPALKQAEVGIAMFNATDIAKSSASAVLLKEGLSAMPEMVTAGRLVHARLFNWMMVRIAKTIQIVGFTVILFIITGVWVLAPLNLLELLVLVDLTSLSMSTDNVPISAKPNVWRVSQLALLSGCVGFISLVEGISLYYILQPWIRGKPLYINNVCFQILFWMGLANQYCFRVRGFFWQTIPSFWLAVMSSISIVFVVVTCSVGSDVLMLTKIPFEITASIIAWSFVVQLVLNNALTYLLFKTCFPSEVAVLKKPKRTPSESSSSTAKREELDIV